VPQELQRKKGAHEPQDACNTCSTTPFGASSWSLQLLTGAVRSKPLLHPPALLLEKRSVRVGEEPGTGRGTRAVALRWPAASHEELATVGSLYKGLRGLVSRGVRRNEVLSGEAPLMSLVRSDVESL
jgi:hypothetical protein